MVRTPPPMPPPTPTAEAAIMGPRTLLQAVDLHVAYGRVAALRGVSIYVEEREIVAVLGANGAGKTSLMKALSGLVIARGEVRFRGRDITRAAAERRARMGMALVPEGRMIFAPLTVAENLRLGMLPEGWRLNRGLFAERVERVIALFPGLAAKLAAPAGSLSGGQQQMLAIGRALMSAPKAILLDEPSLGLAPLVIEDIFATLLRLNDEDGLSVLLAEQNIHHALQIADRAYVLEVGEVVIADEAAALIERTDIEDVYMGRRATYGSTAPPAGTNGRPNRWRSTGRGPTG